MASGTIKVEDKGHTVICTLDLNEKNVINASFTEQMSAILDRYENNDTIRAMIVTGEGDFFSNGFDPSVLVGASAQEVEKNVGDAFRLLSRFYTAPYFTIQAINGHAMGYGAVWALFFDFRFMIDGKARFGYPEALIGLALPASTSLLLKDLVGTTTARDLAVFGTGLKPDKALQLGLVDQLFPKEELVSRAEKFAAKFVPMSRQGLVNNKKSLQISMPPERVAQAIDLDVEGSKEAILSADGQEGMKSLLEGRRPKFA